MCEVIQLLYSNECTRDQYPFNVQMRTGTGPALVTVSLSLFLFFRGEVLPATSSPPHLIFFSTLLLSPVFFFQSPSSPVNTSD